MSVDTIHPSRPAPWTDTAAARAVGEPTAGIDWASDEHAVAVVDAGGVQLRRATVAHTKSGLNQLVTDAVPGRGARGRDRTR